jgi:hypothetical protein
MARHQYQGLGHRLRIAFEWLAITPLVYRLPVVPYEADDL